MIVPIVITTVEVPEAASTLLLLKLPTNDKGDYITAVHPVKVTDRTSHTEWLDGLQEALSRALSELSGSWGAPKLAREQLLSEIATKLAHKELYPGIGSK